MTFFSAAKHYLVVPLKLVASSTPDSLLYGIDFDLLEIVGKPLEDRLRETPSLKTFLASMPKTLSAVDV